MTALRRRLVVTLGWLLMPIAAWATAFFVSWIAALVGAGQESALVGFYLTVGWALGRMRNTGRQQEDISFLDVNVPGFAIFHNAEGYVTLDLVEELLTVLDVIVFALIGSTDDHYENL